MSVIKNKIKCKVLELDGVDIAPKISQLNTIVGGTQLEIVAKDDILIGDPGSQISVIGHIDDKSVHFKIDDAIDATTDAAKSAVWSAFHTHQMKTALSTELHNNNTALNNKIDDVQSQLDAKVSDTVETTSTKAYSKTKVNNIQTSLTNAHTSLSSEVTTVKATTQTNTNNITNLTGRVTTNESDIVNIKNDVTTLQAAGGGGGGDVSSITYTKNDTHATPAAGKVKTYVKSDGALYKKDENGAESAIGNVVGPSSSTANAVALYNGTTGKLLNNSQITVDGSSVTFNGQSLYKTGLMYPNANESYDLGSSALRYRDLYCKNVWASGVINVQNNDSTVGQVRVGDGSYAYIAEYGTADTDTLYLHGSDYPTRNGSRIYHNLDFAKVSDRNCKTNINPFKIDNPVDRINDLELVSFNLIGDGEEGSKDTAHLGDKQLHHGYIAQDVQVTFPEAVSTVDRYKTKENGDYIFDEHGNKVKETRYHLTTFYFTLLQNEAIKELSSTIRNLQERIAMLESR